MSEILGLFINILTLNTLAVYDKYFLLNRENLPQQIQIQLSKE